jgi:hypothetical protein
VGPAAKWQAHHQNHRRMAKNERYKSWMVEDSRFCGSMAKTKLEQKLDGQIDLFLLLK